MLEEKWWKPKSFEQLEKEEKERQFKTWVKQKCSSIICFITSGKCEFTHNREEDGVMALYCKTIERFEKCYHVNINDFWDKDNPMKMNITKVY